MGKFVINGAVILRKIKFNFLLLLLFFKLFIIFFIHLTSKRFFLHVLIEQNHMVRNIGVKIMRVQQVGKVNFGHMIVADSGASVPEGSYKGEVVSTRDGRELGELKGIVAPNGFRHEGDYTDGLRNMLAETELAHRDAIRQLSGDDRLLDGVVVYTPGPSKGNIIGEIGNLKTTAGQSLKNIDLNGIPDELRRRVEAMGIEVVEKPTLLGTNDMIGGTCATLEDLARLGLLEDEFRATYHMMGGGHGRGALSVIGDIIEVETSELGRLNISGVGNDIVTAEKAGTSTPALINHFGEFLGLRPEDIAKLRGTGNAKIVTQHQLIESNPAEIAKLRETGLFLESPAGDSVQFRLKHMPISDHEAAGKFAVGKFAETAARVCHIDVLKGVNRVILAGPLVKGLGMDLRHNPKLSGGVSLIDMIRRATADLLDSVGTKMGTLNNCQITDSINVGSNARGGFVAHKFGKPSSYRGNVLRLPLEAVKQFARRV